MGWVSSVFFFRRAACSKQISEKSPVTMTIVALANKLSNENMAVPQPVRCIVSEGRRHLARGVPYLIH